MNAPNDPGLPISRTPPSVEAVLGLYHVEGETEALRAFLESDPEIGEVLEALPVHASAEFKDPRLEIFLREPIEGSHSEPYIVVRIYSHLNVKSALTALESLDNALWDQFDPHLELKVVVLVEPI